MDADVIIAGGGILGLAVAYRLLEARPRTKLILLEKENRLAVHQTGNNSGVIHSGIYYKPGSRKAENCREGYFQLLEFCQREGIPFEICGKIIVATDPREFSALAELLRRGCANGLKGIRMIGPEELVEREPHVVGLRGIHVPETGIVNYRTVSEKYGEKVRGMGGTIKLNARVKRIQLKGDVVEVDTLEGAYTAGLLVTCGGLQSDQLASQTGPIDFRITPFRGEYYNVSRSRHYLVKNLIYPVPDPAFPFLGVHFTRRIDGSVEAGPNAVLAFKREGYRRTDFSLSDTFQTLSWPGFRKVARKYWKVGLGEFYRSLSKSAFVRALQRLIPEIQESDLEPGGAGVRAQACNIDGNLMDDFHILEQERVIHVCNAPSPAATSSLSIGKTISAHLAKKLL